ncbi:hypothetical protein [Pontixanthobacter gangjinensis]|uniref:Uncharacterized protein n=1 Tax=Pontixanthobacter gangjinensis TaxID=1028742 RepID=A0A6I4SPT4_9SPHN|nr:hypothetical protein [Pontixanthobacter gangjinensis]MXO57794.1 hypothetical protein [Pontixanthobacter gangjinensis]
MTRSLLHFVGFRDDRYWNAVRIWGEPDAIHEAWDQYAADEIAPGDVVIFAEGNAGAQPRSFSAEAERSRQARAAARSYPTEPME